MISFDRAYLESKGYDLTTIVIFTKKDSYKEFKRENVREVKGGETIAVTYTI